MDDGPSDSDFVPNANDPRHPADVRLGAGLLVRLIDHAPQRHPAAVHFRCDSITRDRVIPKERICDL